MQQEEHNNFVNAVSTKKMVITMANEGAFILTIGSWKIPVTTHKVTRDYH